MVAAIVLAGPINSDWFDAYIEQILVLTPKPGDVVILDNLFSHKRLAVKRLVEAAGATFAFLQPYSPDFNPIEKAFSKLKANLRRLGERTVSGLWDAIGSLASMFNALANCCTQCGKKAFATGRADLHINMSHVRACGFRRNLYDRSNLLQGHSTHCH
jgi:transposase